MRIFQRETAFRVHLLVAREPQLKALWRHLVTHKAWLKRKAGRRGTILAILALMDVSYGVSLLAGHSPAFTKASLVMPIARWGWVWIAVGIICLTGVLAERDRLQFATAVLLKTSWALLSMSHWLTTRNTHPHWHGGARWQGWGTVAVWLGFAAVVLVCTGWPELPDNLPPDKQP